MDSNAAQQGRSKHLRAGANPSERTTSRRAWSRKLEGEFCQLFAELLHDEDQPVLFRSALRPGFPDGVLIHAAKLERYLIITIPEAIQEQLRDGATSVYLGLGHELEREELERELPGVEIVGRSEPYIVWRWRRLGAVREEASAGLD